MENSIEKEYGVKNRKFSSRMQARLLLVFCVITLLLVVLMGRLIYFMQMDGERYAKLVLSRQSYVSSVLPYQRGDILDRNGTVLARSELQYRLIIDPKRLLIYEDYIAPTTAALKEHFNIQTEEIQTILQERSESQYVILLKNLKYDIVDAFETLMEEEDSKIYGVWFEEEYVRSYPYDTLASDLLGFTSADNNGYFGIEEYYNNELNGTNGREYGYYDSSLNIERLVEKPENGNSIVSTIDANAQRIIQKHITEFNTEFGSEFIGILIMNPNNGEIIAMASDQEYNLNKPRSLEGFYTEDEIAAMTEDEKMVALNTLWKNDVISRNFEPGSTFKPFTVAAGLEEAIISDSSTFYCDGGEQFGGVFIRCSNKNGHGDITLAEAVMKSCNDALMQIAAMEGREIFFQYEKRFGIGEKTGIDLPGEESGIIIGVDNLNVTELATSSFGQSTSVPMLQMAAGFSSLVNGGNYYQPHIVKQIINDSGATVKQIDKVLIKQTVSEETSELLQKYLYQTVEAGTAKHAKVPGYAVGGKTGTAEKLPRGTDNYVVSFLGAVPAINPEMVIYVVIDEPHNVVKQTSSIATKLASRVLTEVLPALGIYPEGEIDYLLPTEEENDNSSDDQDNTSQENTDDTSNTENNDDADRENDDTTENSENTENTENNENNENSENAENAENGENTENGENSENTENTENTDNDENNDNTENSEHSGSEESSDNEDT